MNIPVVLYGAGRASKIEMERAISEGYVPVCFVDADKNKQGLIHMGLPIFSLDQVKEKYVDFYVYLTTSIELRHEIFSYLLEHGINSRQILNYYVESIGCWELDHKMTIENIYKAGVYPCCKVNDMMNNPPEVKWADSGWNMDSVITEFLNMRDKLISSLRSEEPCQCTGCLLVRKEQRAYNKTIKLLCLSFDLPCQLSCIYCHHNNATYPSRADVESANAVQNFDYKQFIETLERRRLLAKDARIVFAGGEITINPKINEILDAIQNYKIDIYTNAVIFNQKVAGLAARPGSSLLISIDSGTRETYRLIKGLDVFSKVWGNVNKYVQYGAKVAVKYIFLDDNSTEKDVIGFVNRATVAGVSEIRISADSYRQTSYSEWQMKLVAKMIKMSEDNGIHFGYEETVKPNERSSIRELLNKSEV